jgi:hypothetical protein
MMQNSLRLWVGEMKLPSKFQYNFHVPFLRVHKVIYISLQFKLWGCVQKFPDWVDNEIYGYNNKHSLRSNTKGYGGKTH